MSGRCFVQCWSPCCDNIYTYVLLVSSVLVSPVPVRFVELSPASLITVAATTRMTTTLLLLLLVLLLLSNIYINSAPFYGTS